MDDKAKYLVFDVESTGIDVFEDRIVQLYMATADDKGEILDSWEWIINPGVEVPSGASDVHGFTTEYLVENGTDPHKALWEADLVIKEAVRNNLTFVAYNLNYDMSIITAEMARNSLGSRYGFWITDNTSLFDPLVVDRAEDKYRKGKRKLENVAAHYGVPFNPDEAHKADYDVAVTAKVAVKVAEKFGIPSTERQAEMYKSWAEGLESYLKRTDPEATVNGDWPLRLKENN